MSFTKYTLLSNPKNYGADRAASSIKYLVYHYTGNKTDKAVNNANYFKNNTVNASAHYFVDDTTVYRSVPDLTSAWAVGDNKYSDCNTTGGGTMYGKITNSNSLSIEMCSVNGEISEATMENSIALGQELMKKYNIPISNVYRHFDVSGKHCPGWTGWYGSDSSKWISFKNRLSNDVSDADTSASDNTSTTQNSNASANISVSTNTSASANTSASTSTSATTSASTASKELYRVRKTWSDVSGQLGAFYSLENAKNACINGYSVFDSNGNIVYTNSSSNCDGYAGTSGVSLGKFQIIIE